MPPKCSARLRKPRSGRAGRDTAVSSFRGVPQRVRNTVLAKLDHSRPLGCASEQFTGWSNNYFNYLRFNISLETNEISACAADKSSMCCVLLKRRSCHRLCSFLKLLLPEKVVEMIVVPCMNNGSTQSPAPPARHRRAQNIVWEGGMMRLETLIDSLSASSLSFY